MKVFENYKCDGQMNIFDFIKPYNVGFLKFHIKMMHDSKVAKLKGLTRDEFIHKECGKNLCLDVCDLSNGQRFIVTDDISYRPDLDHVPWDDYIAMFKEIWGDEE